jgi:transcriptional repressor NrdR
LNGILTACQKRKIDFSIIQRALKEIEEQIQDLGKEEVHSSQIGDIVARKLSEIDDVAYVRFVSVYKRFNTLEEFKKELQEIEKNTKKHKKQETTKG